MIEKSIMLLLGYILTLFFSELTLSTTARSFSVLELTQQFVYAVAIAFVVLFSVFVIILIKKYRMTRSLLEEKDHAFKMIEHQNIILEQREKDMTDSLIYAHRIQEARLPTQEYFRKHFPSSFIFFKPKDIVSGDFYWIGEKDGWVYVVVADCTGHGVSGALMSMIGMDFIEKAITEYNITTPSKILAFLDESLEKTFNRKINFDTTVMDGMDIGLCAINKKEKKVIYSGAFFPLYVIKNNSLTQVSGDKIIIGMNPEKRIYTDHEIDVKDDDILYLSSDGYADQFGGTDNKKFMYRRFRYLLLNIHNFSVDDQKSVLEENLKNWMGLNQQVDDIMVIGFKPF